VIYEPGYTAEERARQVAAVQEQRKKRWNYKRRELRPRTLLRAMGRQERISPEWLRDLMEQQYANPVVSLYLTMTGEKMTPEPKAVLRSFHALKTHVMEDRKEYLESLPRAQKLALDRDIGEIESFLQEDFSGDNLRSLIVFRSGEELNRVAKLFVHHGGRTRKSIPIPTCCPSKSSWKRTRGSYWSRRRRKKADF
jgi:hypothetical protein